MEKNAKAEYYFGSKEVLERAAFENEFEGSLTTSTELQKLELIHELPSAFWRSVWLPLANYGTLEITEYNFETGELRFIPYEDSDWLAKRKVLIGDPIWQMNLDYDPARGWNQEGASNLCIWEANGYQELKEVVTSFINDAQLLLRRTLTIQLNLMTQDPVPLNNIQKWQKLWDEAAHGQNHDIGATIKHKDGPEKVFSFRFGSQNSNQVWFAKRDKSNMWYILWYMENL